VTVVDPRGGAKLTTLTGSGRGAVGVIAVWGQGALAVVEAVFRPNQGSSLSSAPRGRLRLGRIGRGLGDEVVAVVLDGTPPVVEVQSHGGTAALALVTAALVEVGAEPAGPDEWAEQLGGSPSRAQAMLDLASVTTLRAASILMDQAHGALDRVLEEVLDKIQSGPLALALGQVERLLSHAQLGIRLVTGWRVVIRGRPNVGKSLLLNALAGYQRTIVDPTPGTTRDVVGVDVALDGWPVRLIDTAGVRVTGDALEKSGIERAIREAAAADLILEVLDRSQPLKADDLGWLSEAPHAPRIVVANKADLPGAWALESSPLGATPVVIVSAKLEEGLDRLIETVVWQLVPDPPELGAGVPFRIDHLESLLAATSALRDGNRHEAIRAIERLI